MAINSNGLFALYEVAGTIPRFQCSTKKWAQCKLRNTYHEGALPSKKATVLLCDRENHLNVKRREFYETWIWERRKPRSSLSNHFADQEAARHVREQKVARIHLPVRIYWSSAEYTLWIGQAKVQVAVVYCRGSPCFIADHFLLHSVLWPLESRPCFPSHTYPATWNCHQQRWKFTLWIRGAKRKKFVFQF